MLGATAQKMHCTSLQHLQVNGLLVFKKLQVAKPIKVIHLPKLGDRPVPTAFAHLARGLSLILKEARFSGI